MFAVKTTVLRQQIIFVLQTNTSRGQSPYPPTHGQNSGSYPSSPQQQPGGPPPPPPQSSNQGTAAAQYSPYPQRYPTPPGPATGPNHRTAYSQHQVKALKKFSPFYLILYTSKMKFGYDLKI